MSPLPLMLLISTALGPVMDTPLAAVQDPARLREMILDKQHSRLQVGQAALLLVQSNSIDSTEIVRQGLRQTDKPSYF